MSVHDLGREEPRQLVLWERIWRLCWTQSRLQHSMGKPAVLPVGLEGAGLEAEPAQSSAEGWTQGKAWGEHRGSSERSEKADRFGCSLGAGVVA